MPDALESFVADFDRSSGYETESLLKESPHELTELVRGPDGVQLVRKCLQVEPGSIHPYELLKGSHCPYLPEIREAVRVGDRLMVLMEYVEGQTLREYVSAHGPLPVADASRMVFCLCDALAFLHGFEAGPLIHRDVNPSNVMVSEDRFCLIDLGIARSWKQGAAQDTVLWGTGGYAAPEQYGFGQTDARTDQYGLGMTIRYALTGLEPTQAGECPLKWEDDVVACMTALDPAKRFKDIGQAKSAFSCGGSGTGQERGSAAGTGLSGLSARLNHLDELQGLTSRHPLMSLLWRAWQVVCTLAMAMVVAAMSMAFRDPTDNLNRIDSVYAAVFYAVIPWAICTNPLGLTRKFPWLLSGRYPKLVGLLIGCGLSVIPYAILLTIFGLSTS